MKILVALGLFVICFGFIGCGSSGTSTVTPKVVTVSGIVADGLIEGATVWLDLTDDSIIDPHEPKDQSDADGSYRLLYNSSIERGLKVRSRGGIDKDTNLAFDGELESSITKSISNSETLTQMISPILTLKSKGVSEERLRVLFPNLPQGELESMHPVDDPNLHLSNVMAHTLVKQVSSTVSGNPLTDQIADVYTKLSEELQSGTTGTFSDLNISDFIIKVSGVEATKASSIATVINQVMDHFNELDLNSETARQRMQEVQSLSQDLISDSIKDFLGLGEGSAPSLNEFLVSEIDQFIELNSLRQTDNTTSINQTESTSQISQSIQTCKQADNFIDKSDLEPSLVFNQNSQVAAYCETDYLIIESNGIPTYQVQQLTPTQLSSKNYRYVIPLNPVWSETPSEIPHLGPVAVTVTGLPIYAPNTAADLDYADAVLEGITDNCGGHVGPNGDYHFHARPDCPFEQASELASTILAYAFDGYPIMAPYVCSDESCSSLRKVSGSWQKCTDETCHSVAIKELQSSWSMTNPTVTATWDAHAFVKDSGDLDQCNGMRDSDGNYRYYATDTFPYNLGCYHGVINPQLNNLEPGWSERDTTNQGGPGSGPPAGGPADPPDLNRAAEILGIDVETLRSALGPPPPDLNAAALTLGITVAELENALFNQ